MIFKVGDKVIIKHYTEECAELFTRDFKYGNSYYNTLGLEGIVHYVYLSGECDVKTKDYIFTYHSSALELINSFTIKNIYDF